MQALIIIIIFEIVVFLIVMNAMDGQTVMMDQMKLIVEVQNLQNAQMVNMIVVKLVAGWVSA